MKKNKKNNSIYYYIIGLSILYIGFFYPTLIDHSLGFVGSGLITIPLEIGILLISLIGITSNKKGFINFLLGIFIIGLLIWSLMMFGDRNGDYYGGYSILYKIQNNIEKQPNVIIDTATIK